MTTGYYKTHELTQIDLADNEFKEGWLEIVNKDPLNPNGKEVIGKTTPLALAAMVMASSGALMVDGSNAMEADLTMPRYSSVKFRGDEGDSYIRNIYDVDAEVDKLQLVSGIVQATGVMYVDGRLGVATPVYGPLRIGDSPLQSTSIAVNALNVCGANQTVPYTVYPSPDNVTVTHKNYASKIALNAFVNKPGVYGVDMMESTLAIVQDCTDGETRIIDTFINDYNGIGGDIAQAMGQVFIARNGASAVPIYRSRYDGTTYSHIEKVNTSNEREYFAKETTNFDGVVNQHNTVSTHGDPLEPTHVLKTTVSTNKIETKFYKSLENGGSTALYFGIDDTTPYMNAYASGSCSTFNKTGLTTYDDSEMYSLVRPDYVKLYNLQTQTDYSELKRNQFKLASTAVTSTATPALYNIKYGTIYNLDLKYNIIKICAGATGDNCTEITPTVGLKTYWTSGGYSGTFDYYGAYVYDGTNKLETYAGEIKTGNLAGTIYSKLTPGIVNIKDSNGSEIYSQTQGSGATRNISIAGKSGAAASGTFSDFNINQYGCSLSAYSGNVIMAGINLESDNTLGTWYYSTAHRFRNKENSAYYAVIQSGGLDLLSGVYQIGGNSINIQATSAPSTAPNHPGQIHNDSTNKQAYIAQGTSTASDWTALRTGLNGTAEIYQQDNTTATTISSQNTWEEINNYSSGVLMGFTVANSDITVSSGYGGTYTVSGFISAKTAGTNKNYEFAISINDVIVDKTRSERLFATSTDIGSVAVNGTIQVIPTDIVKIEVRCLDAVVSDITIVKSNITIKPV